MKWYKSPFHKSPVVPSSPCVKPLFPWGDAASLYPAHLPLCVEGPGEQLLRVLRPLLREAQDQEIPVFLQEGLHPFLALSDLPIPTSFRLPPVVRGTTPETVAQALEEVVEFQATRGSRDSQWPVLMLCSGLGAHRKTVLEQMQSLGGLGLIYVKRTSQPYLERQEFAAQLYCLEDGRAHLRRGQDYYSFRVSDEPKALYVPRFPRQAPTF